MIAAYLELLQLLFASAACAESAICGSYLYRGQHIALDVARGLHALHLKGIIHFDLKSPNVLISTDYTAKVCLHLGC